MSDLISRGLAIDYLVKKANGIGAYGYISAKEIHDYLKELPSAESERKMGKWIDTGSGQECSECHEIQYGYDSFRYFCAYCGADMRGEQDE